MCIYTYILFVLAIVNLKTELDYTYYKMGCSTSVNPKSHVENQNVPERNPSPVKQEKPPSPQPDPVAAIENEPERTREEIINYYQNEYSELRLLLRMLLNAVEKMDQLLECGIKSQKHLDEAKNALEEFVDISKIDNTWSVLGDFLADINGAETFTQTLSKLYETNTNIAVSDLQDTNTPEATAQLIVFGITMSLLDLTDKSVPFTISCANSGLVPVLTEFCMALAANISDQGHNWADMQLSGKLFTQTLGTLHNIARRAENRWHCAKVRSLVPTLLDWTTSKGNYWGVLSLLTLSFVIDEERNHLLKTKEGVLRFLVELLEATLNESNRRFLGYSSTELAEGLTQIAVNDSNKRLLAELGAIPILKNMMNTANNEKEQESAATAFYVLSFNEENRKEIENESETMEILQRLSKSENRQVKMIAEGALWEVLGKQRRVKEAESVAPTAASLSSSDRKHVMISYQWDVQQTMIAVKNSLQEAGYHVWMDIEKMEGSTLEAMAKAVENASVVIIGVSQKYKESPNCRSEAEYTYQVRHFRLDLK